MAPYLCDAGRRVERAPPLGARAPCRRVAACRASTRSFSGIVRRSRTPSQASRKPTSSSPYTRSPLRTMARITAFRPGQSPPPVRMPTRTGSSVEGRAGRWGAPRARARRAINRRVGWDASRPVPWRRLRQGVADLRGDHGRGLRRVLPRPTTCCAILAGLLVSGPLYLGLGLRAGQVRLQPQDARRPATRRAPARRAAPTTGAASDGDSARPRPAPTRRTSAGRTGRRRASAGDRASWPSMPARPGIRSRAVFTDGSPSVASYREFTQHFPRPGWVEHDPTEIWEAARATLHDVVEQVGAASVAAIGITNQRETVVAWDRATGTPYGRAIVWQDRRTAARCDELAAAGALDLVRRAHRASSSTRTSAAPSSSGCSARAASRSPTDLALGTIDAWLIWNLTGGEVFATDATNASRTMLFDITRLRWDEELCDLLHVPIDRLPGGRPVERAGRASRRTAAARRAGSRSAASPATSRRRCSARPASSPGMAKNTYGTGSFVLLNVGADVPAAGRGDADDRGLDAGRRHGRLRPRGGHLLHRIGDPVAARRARHHRRRRRDRTAGGQRRRQRRRVRRAGVHRARLAVVGPVRPRHDRRDHPRDDPCPPRPGRRRGDGVPDPRCRRGDGAGQRPIADRAAGRRWRVGDGRAAAAARPIRSACPCSDRANERRQPSARRTSPPWPKAWCRTSTPWPAQWQLDASFAPAADRTAADAAHAAWLRAVGRSRSWVA